MAIACEKSDHSRILRICAAHLVLGPVDSSEAVVLDHRRRLDARIHIGVAEEVFGRSLGVESAGIWQPQAYVSVGLVDL